VVKGTSKREAQGMKLVSYIALDVSEKYQSHKHWLLEQLEVAQVLKCKW